MNDSLKGVCQSYLVRSLSGHADHSSAPAQPTVTDSLVHDGGGVLGQKRLWPFFYSKTNLLRNTGVIAHCHYTYLMCIIWQVCNTSGISLRNYCHSQYNERFHWPPAPVIFILPVYHSLLVFLCLPCPNPRAATDLICFLSL